MQSETQAFSAPFAMFDRIIVDAIAVKNRPGVRAPVGGVGKEK